MRIELQIAQGNKMDGERIGLAEILDEGEMLKLSDGCVFRVDPFDRSEARTWNIESEIQLAETRDCVFNYTFTNWDRGSWIRAMRLN